MQGDLGASLEIIDLLKHGIESAESIALHHSLRMTSCKHPVDMMTISLIILCGASLRLTLYSCN